MIEGSETRSSSRRRRLRPQSGVAFPLRAGETLRVIDVEGEQVADLIAFANGDDEWLSSGRTIDYNGTIRLTAGHVLYSNRSTAMLTIVADTVGCHDFLFAPCSPEMFERLYGFEPGHPSCFRNLADNLAHFGIAEDRIPTTFNIFMNAEIGASGEIKVLPPLSKAGDYIELRAEIDLVVGLTACSAELSNNWRFKPIEYEVVPASHQAP
jgi:uncharacterized protein YcgI (DUF1989 family)